MNTIEISLYLLSIVRKGRSIPYSRQAINQPSAELCWLNENPIQLKGRKATEEEEENISLCVCNTYFAYPIKRTAVE